MLLDWQSLVYPVDGAPPALPTPTFTGGYFFYEDRVALAKWAARRKRDEDEAQREALAAVAAVKATVRRNYDGLSKLAESARKKAFDAELADFSATFRREYAKALAREFDIVQEEETIVLVAAALFAIH